MTQWRYSAVAWLVELRQQSVSSSLEADFFNVVRHCVRLFRESGNVTHKSRGCRPIDLKSKLLKMFEKLSTQHQHLCEESEQNNFKEGHYFISLLDAGVS